MANNRDNALKPSSPHSSTGVADSLKGTLDTRLTAFSPDGGSAKSTTKLLKNFIHSASATPPVRLPVNGHRASMSHFDKDPFIGPFHDTRLSPTASAFRPVVSVAGYAPPHQADIVSMSLSTELGLSRHLAVSSSVTLSVAEIERCLMVIISPPPPCILL